MSTTIDGRARVLAVAFGLGAWVAGCQSKCLDTGTGCVAAGTDADADTDTDEDTEPDSEADSREGCVRGMDSAFCLVYYSGDAQTDQGSFEAGHFGWVVSGYTVACTDLAEWSTTGVAAPDCPQCDWAFNLTLAGGTAVGTSCDLLDLHGDEWDGFTGSWGFADTYDYLDNGTVYTLELAVLYYSVAYGAWYPFAYNFEGEGYSHGTAESVTFSRYYGYVHYYPY